MELNGMCELTIQNNGFTNKSKFVEYSLLLLRSNAPVRLHEATRPRQ